MGAGAGPQGCGPGGKDAAPACGVARLQKRKGQGAPRPGAAPGGHAGRLILAEKACPPRQGRPQARRPGLFRRRPPRGFGLPGQTRPAAPALFKRPLTSVTSFGLSLIHILMGSEVYLYLDCRGAKMTARVAPATASRTGSHVKVAFDTAKLHLFDAESELAILN